MKYIKVCPKCGAIKISLEEDFYQCIWCGTDLIETKYEAKYPVDWSKSMEYINAWEKRWMKSIVFLIHYLTKLRMKDEKMLRILINRRKDKICVSM